MAGVAWPFNETYVGGVPSGAPAVSARQKRQMNASFVAMGSSARPLGAKSGVRVGTPASVVTITGSGSSYTWSAGGFGGTIDGEANAAAGAYQYAFENAETGSISAQGAAARKDRLDVQISDSDEGDGAGTKTVQVIYTQGAATGGAVPDAPARSHALGIINVPATTGAPTFTWAPEWAGTDRWTFNTVAERDAYVLLIGSANVPPQQQATVIADTVSSSNNGTSVWSGSTWLTLSGGRVPLHPTASISGGGTATVLPSGAVSFDQAVGLILTAFTGFRRYEIKVDTYGVNDGYPSTQDVGMTAQLCLAGAPATANQYYANTNNGIGFWPIGGNGQNGRDIIISLSDVSVAKTTKGSAWGAAWNGGTGQNTGFSTGLGHLATTAYDGIQLNLGKSSGFASVYGIAD